MKNSHKSLLLSCLFMFFLLSVTSQNNLDSIIDEVQEHLKTRELSIAQSIINQTLEENKLKDELDVLKINFWQAKVDIQKGKDEKALKNLLSSFSEMEKFKNSSYYFKYSQEIGRLFGRVKNYSNSFKYFEIALDNAFFRRDSLEISEAHFNLGSAYQMKNEIDSAAIYYNKVINFFPVHSKNKNVLATTYSNYIGISVLKNNFKQAQEYGEKSYEIHSHANDTIKMAGVLTNLGGISMYYKDLDKSNEYSYRSIKLLEKKNDIKSREIKALTLDNISQVFYLKGDFQKAYDLLFESATISNQIITDNLESKVTEIEAKYNVAKENELTKIEENKRQRAEYLLYIAGIGLLVLLGFLWFFYRDNKFKRLNLRLAHRQEKIEAERKMERVQNDMQIKVLNATLDAKESERKYIAGILHDSVSTLLSSASMHLYALKTKLKDQQIDEISKTENIVSEASDKIRNLSHKLISAVLLKFGLKAAVEDLCEKYSNSQLSFTCSAKDLVRFDQSFEIKIYNIIEELINNILKHSEATNATIDMKYEEGKLVINIDDNGKGFVVEEIFEKDGLGLNRIDARIKMMDGKFKVNSEIKKGTKIYINVPC